MRHCKGIRCCQIIIESIRFPFGHEQTTLNFTTFIAPNANVITET
jgi:hypothetical protein